MIGKALLASVMATVLLGAAGSLAQPDSGDDPAPSATGTGTQQAPVNEKPDNAAPAAPRKTSPSDYRASEEISEDLPVSFPADI